MPTYPEAPPRRSPSDEFACAVAPFRIDIVQGATAITAKERFGLSQREDEVLASIWAGRTDEEISAELKISRPTVREYKRRLQSKVGANRPSEIVAATMRGLPHIGCSH